MLLTRNEISEDAQAKSFWMVSLLILQQDIGYE